MINSGCLPLPHISIGISTKLSLFLKRRHYKFVSLLVSYSRNPPKELTSRDNSIRRIKWMPKCIESNLSEDSRSEKFNLVHQKAYRTLHQKGIKTIRLRNQGNQNLLQLCQILRKISPAIKMSECELSQETYLRKKSVIPFLKKYNLRQIVIKARHELLTQYLEVFVQLPEELQPRVSVIECFPSSFEKVRHPEMLEKISRTIQRFSKLKTLVITCLVQDVINWDSQVWRSFPLETIKELKLSFSFKTEKNDIQRIITRSMNIQKLFMNCRDGLGRRPSEKINLINEILKQTSKNLSSFILNMDASKELRDLLIGFLTCHQQNVVCLGLNAHYCLIETVIPLKPSVFISFLRMCLIPLQQSEDFPNSKNNKTLYEEALLYFPINQATADLFLKEFGPHIRTLFLSFRFTSTEKLVDGLNFGEIFIEKVLQTNPKVEKINLNLIFRVGKVTKELMDQISARSASFICYSSLKFCHISVILPRYQVEIIYPTFERIKHGKNDKVLNMSHRLPVEVVNKRSFESNALFN